MSYSRSPGRWLGPLALLAALVAVFVIFNATTGDEEPTQTAKQTSTGEKKKSGGKKKSSSEEEQTSAEETGVSVEELQELNPGVDSNSLSIGQELRLAR